MLTELVLKELESAIISTLIEMPIDYGIRFFTPKAKKYVLIKKIRKRESYLKEKYKDRFTLPKHLDQDSFFEWLKETGTIKRIISFSNNDDISNISVEQIQLCKEVFFKDAFEAAQIQTWHEKEELRIFLNELFQYVEELFWKTSNENDVFLYKKSLSEIKKILNDSVEEIKKKVDYHDSFAEYIDNQKMQQDAPYKLDYRSGEIPFVGRTEELKELDAFCACEAQVSWWAVTGKGGSGKSRFAYQYIENHINSSDWKMCFLPDTFFKQSHEGGKYKLWITWFYHKNLLLVVDYVQRYAEETARWIEELSTNNSVTKKIRILLLERTGSEESLWYKGNFDKSVVASHKYEKAFLKLQSKDADLILFAGKYAEKNKKQISEADAMDALAKLKTIDPEARILYFIMILEAIFNEKPWRNWNRNDLADYILKRELKNIEIRFEYNQDLLRSYSILLAFCTATKKLPFFEQPRTLPELIKKEIEEILNNTCNKKSCSKDQLCALLQLEDDALQPVTPDIIGEYMVLHIIDQYFFTKEDKKQFIESMWIYDSDDFHFFILRSFEDKMYEKSYDYIKDLILFDTIPPGNIHVIENYSKLISELANTNDLKKIFKYIKILEKLYHDHSHNTIIAHSYAFGLFQLSYRQKPPELKDTLEKLEYIANMHTGNTTIQALYAYGLFMLSYYRNLPETKKALEKLKLLAESHADIPLFQTTYANGLYNLSCMQILPEMRETLGKLARLAEVYSDNTEIQIKYATGLVNLSYYQKLTEKQETIYKLEYLSKVHIDNLEIQELYANGLVNLSSAQKFPEINKTISKLEQLAIKYANSVEINAEYASGLFNLSKTQEPAEIEETAIQIEQLARDHVGNATIQSAYACILLNLSCCQQTPEIEETVKKLEQLAMKYTNNIKIQITYAKSLFNLSNKQELAERKKTVRKLALFSEKYTDNAVIQETYAKTLFNLSNKQEPMDKMETMESLEQLARMYTDNAEIQIAYTIGLSLLLSHDQKLSEMKETIEKLAHCAKSHIEIDEIQETYAHGLLILIYKQKPSERKEYKEKLAQLALKYTDNSKIQTTNEIVQSKL